jgi:hypothetical protein
LTYSSCRESKVVWQRRRNSGWVVSKQSW